MTKQIVQDGHKALREISKVVPASYIQSEEIQNLIKDMHKSLALREDGVALAAPQIGANWRIFVISPKAWKGEPGPLVYINPTIKSASREATWVDEGCLSVTGIYGQTLRHDKATVRAYDETGKVFELGGSGLLAQIFQHEIDHLDGILFTDHAENLEEVEIKK